MKEFYQIKTKDFKNLCKKAEDLSSIINVILVFCENKLDCAEEECLIPVVKHSLNSAEILYLKMLDIKDGTNEYTDIP